VQKATKLTASHPQSARKQYTTSHEEVNGQLDCELFQRVSSEITGVTSVFCELRPGMIFVTTNGDLQKLDQVLDQVTSSGAVAVVTQEEVGDAARRLKSDIPIVQVENSRLALALLASRLSRVQPDTIVAVTGTMGKTSVAEFTRQIFTFAGYPAASIGTLGVIHSRGNTNTKWTTPEPVTVHRVLNDLAEDGVTHVSMEASSHGLSQYRLDGVKLATAGFTNLSQDHQDYHHSMPSYFEAKMRLFGDLLNGENASVINVDTYWGQKAAEYVKARGGNLLSVGYQGSDIMVTSCHKRCDRLELELDGITGKSSVSLPFIWDFQVSNAIVAAGLTIAAGLNSETTVAGLEALQPPRGRLEFMGKTPKDAQVFVDYAHNPASMKKVLQTLRLITLRRLVVVFGCGGDRDTMKRPVMGELASRFADTVIVTDDNPRSEDPSSIRHQILSSAPGAIEISDRAEAILYAARRLEAGDVLVVAGKGHETYQEIGNVFAPCSDHDLVRTAMKNCEP